MRTLVALLLLANLGFLALAQGWLQPYLGLSTQHEREPQRLAAQIHPESVRVSAIGPAASAAAAAPTCLVAGPFSLEQIEALEAALPPGSWQREAADSYGEPRFQLRAESADAALRQQLQDQVAATAGATLGACAAAR